MTLITDTAVGRFSTSVDEVMSHVRKPVFVDNAIHHARVEVAMDGKNKVTIEKSNTTTFKVTPERKYKIVEGESSLQVTHNLTPGHRYTGNPFYSDDKISSSNQPDLLFNADAISERLAPSSNASSTTGRTLFLQNMKNQRIANVGFSGDEVHFANPIDVGLRTTDLAIKMGQGNIGHDVLINIGVPFSSSNVGSGRLFHSTKYLAKNFNEVNLKSALKFISRHDKRMILFDRFGNLLYTPLKFTETERTVDSKFKTGSVIENPINDIPNRVIVQGASRALNDFAYAVLDDSERQSGDEGAVTDDGNVVSDMTIRTKQGAKRVARQILQASVTDKGSISSTGHIGFTDLRPGDVVKYNGENKIIIEAKHKMITGESDFVLSNVDTGLEGLISGVREGMILESSKTNPMISEQSQTLNMSFFGNIKINVALNIKERGVGTTKMLLGGTKGTKTRGKIGKNGLQMGAAKRGVNNIRK